MEAFSSVSSMPVATRIEFGAFFGYPITSFVVPASIESLGEECFRNCVSLSEITLAQISSLKKIGAESFRGCLSLQSICLPTSVEILGEYCFSRCASLTALTFEPGSHLCQIDEGAFAFLLLVKICFYF
jgi:hypothetical protein